MLARPGTRAGRPERRAANLAAAVGLLLRLLRFLGWLIFATWVGRKLLGWLFAGTSGAQWPGREPPTAPQTGKPLHRDPICGMHVPEEISVTLELGGQVHHFCSPECRERFRNTQANRTSA